VVIEEDAALGPGVIVLPNVTIGRGAIVTAGSVVTKSIPPKKLVHGNPARTIAFVEMPWDWMCLPKNSPKDFDQLRQPLPIIRGRAASSVA
jgi:serine acetyltransferase